MRRSLSESSIIRASPPWSGSIAFSWRMRTMVLPLTISSICSSDAARAPCGRFLIRSAMSRPPEPVEFPPVDPRDGEDHGGDEHHEQEQPAGVLRLVPPPPIRVLHPFFFFTRSGRFACFPLENSCATSFDGQFAGG